MENRIRLSPVFLLSLLLSLLVVTVVFAANIHASEKWAYGANIGWLNFAPSAGGGVTVYRDHLEGYVWAENAGWIRLGTCSGYPCTHANTGPSNYGVNRDASGNLSGYAWGSNIGWINFNPSHSQVSIDTSTGDFDGYAWGENVGWVHFKSTGGVTYKVTTTTPTSVGLPDFTARAGDSQVYLLAIPLSMALAALHFAKKKLRNNKVI